MFQRILVPLDGSERAELVLPIAAHLARLSHGTVVLLAVVPPPVEFGPYLGGSAQLVQRAIETDCDASAQYLAQVAASPILADVPLEQKVLLDGPAETILSVAETDRVDFILLNSHGRGPLTRWVLGSVAQKVARHAPMPVLVLRNQGIDMGKDTPAHPLCGLVALDGSSVSQAALVPTALLTASLAAPARGILRLVQVVRLPSDQHRREQIVQETSLSLSKVADQFQQDLSQVTNLTMNWSVALTADGDIASTLIRIAETGEGFSGETAEEPCALIGMATHGRGGMARWAMGSITERVLAATRLPLLIVCSPKRGQDEEEARPHFRA